MKQQNKPLAIILDIDGTLADNRTIIHHLTDGNLDYESYHAASVNIPAHEDVLRIAKQAQMEGLAVIVVTARADRFRNLTYNWLSEHGVPFNELHMRPSTDSREDELIKKDILADLRKRYTIVHAVDDNPMNIALFKKEKIRVTAIPGYGLGDYKGDRDDNSISILSPIGSGKCLRCGRVLTRDALFGPECAKTQ
jgi:predicted secreted acid phosphatase